MPRVFLITGTSTGFGQHLVQIVIDAGDIAVGLSPDDTILAGGTNSLMLTIFQRLRATRPNSPFRTQPPRIIWPSNST